MKREFILTADGSHSIYLPEWDEHYHSVHGAVQEAYHVFIRNGLDLFRSGDQVHILEVGFGTGLNAFITWLEMKRRNLKVDYIGVEAYPISEEEVQKLNYVDVLQANEHREIFKKLHRMVWEKKNEISSEFHLHKRKQFFQDISDTNSYNLIYFDAFGARVQPELWTEEIFKKMFESLKANGVLVTYAAKGSVRRTLQTVGFSVERLPGPPGKREMLRAKKQ